MGLGQILTEMYINDISIALVNNFNEQSELIGD